MVEVNKPKFSSVSIYEILESTKRFDAMSFSLEARKVRESLHESGYQLLPMTSNKLIELASYPPRFKRKYVSEFVGSPFILPSQITEVYPKPYKWISGLPPALRSQLTARRGDILLTRSGTIGQCAIVSDKLEGKILSDDLIRIHVKDEYAGFVYAFIKSKAGQLLLTTSNYGAVIKHIEPEHLSNIKIPIIPHKQIVAIQKFIDDYVALVDQSNSLVDKAASLLQDALNLTPVDQLYERVSADSSRPRAMTVDVNNLQNRMDGSFHDNIASEIEKELKEKAIDVKKLGDESLSKQVMLPGRFKRVYVKDDYGAFFLGGKEILNLDPRTEKKLSLKGHSDRIKNELLIRENFILITRSGTIGKVTIAPKAWEDWAVSEHVIRVEPSNQQIAGYLYTWLSSDYGKRLISKYTYGAVVNEIDDNHVRDISVPILEETIMAEIGELVAEANRLRTSAFKAEQQAIAMVDGAIFEG